MSKNYEMTNSDSDDEMQVGLPTSPLQQTPFRPEMA